jgi:hypothetical protein
MVADLVVAHFAAAFLFNLLGASSGVTTTGGDRTEFSELSRRGFHVPLGHLGVTITDLMATIKSATSPEMNDIPPMNTPAITSFGLGHPPPPHAQ